MPQDDDHNYEEGITEKNGSLDAFLSPWGRFMQDLVEPTVVRLFETRGRECNQFSSGARSYRLDPPLEISLIANDDEEIVVVECKPRLSQHHVDEFINFKLEQFKYAFASYKNFRLYGAVTGIYINQGVEHYAYEKGLFVFKPAGDTLEIMNEANFKAREW